MPHFIAERPPADLLDIFSPDSPVPIPLPFIHRLLQLLLPTLPGFPALSPNEQADMRLLVMHQIAAYLPGDLMEAQLAVNMVALNAHAMESFRLAALPDAKPAEAMRASRLGARLMAMHNQMLSGLERRQTARRKAEEIPTERAGYWFKDISVPLPSENPPPPDQWPGDSLAAHNAPALYPEPPAAAAPAEAAPAAAEPENNDNNPLHRGAPDQAEAAGPPDQGPPPRGDRPSFDRSHAMSGDALYRFASRRLDPNQTDADIWAQCEAEAAAEQAELAAEQASQRRVPAPHVP